MSLLLLWRSRRCGGDGEGCDAERFRAGSKMSKQVGEEGCLGIEGQDTVWGSIE